MLVSISALDSFIYLLIFRYVFIGWLCWFSFSDAPIQSKKQQFTEQQKLKQIVSKNVNRAVEDEIRSRAKEGHINLSKAQQAVAKQHKEMAGCSTSTDKSSN